MVSAYRDRGCGTPSVARTVNVVQAGQDLAAPSILSKGMLSVRTGWSSGVSHHTQTFDVVEKFTATFNVARRDFKGESVRVPFHEIPITGRQATAPARGADRGIARYRDISHAA